MDKKIIADSENLMNLSKTFRDFFSEQEAKDIQFEYTNLDGQKKIGTIPTFRKTLAQVKDVAPTKQDLEKAKEDVLTRATQTIKHEVTTLKNNLTRDIASPDILIKKTDEVKDELSTKVDNLIAEKAKNVEDGFANRLATIRQEFSDTKKAFDKKISDLNENALRSINNIEQDVTTLKSNIDEKMSSVLSGAGKDKIIEDVKKQLNVNDVVASMKNDITKQLNTMATNLKTEMKNIEVKLNAQIKKINAEMPKHFETNGEPDLTICRPGDTWWDTDDDRLYTCIMINNKKAWVQVV